MVAHVYRLNLSLLRQTRHRIGEAAVPLRASLPQDLEKDCWTAAQKKTGIPAVEGFQPFSDGFQTPGTVPHPGHISPVIRLIKQNVIHPQCYTCITTLPF